VENVRTPSSPSLSTISQRPRRSRSRLRAGLSPHHFRFANHEHSVDIAKEAHRRGFQVMLHLPMQSVANETPEAQELHPGMPRPKLRR